MQTRTWYSHKLLLGLTLVASSFACSSSDDGNSSDVSDGGMNNETTTKKAETLCAKYGGAEVVDSVVRVQVIGAIAEDCRINAFFTQLSSDAFVRVEDCLSLQVQELMACDGAMYAGAEASNGLPCRSMAEAHAGLGISDADFSALIEDVVAGLSEAGVSTEDINAAAPALLGMQEDIVESDAESTTRDACEGAMTQ